MKNTISKGVLAIFLSMVASTNSFSDDMGVNKFTPMQKFYYSLGQEQAKNVYYKKGYQDALHDFKDLLKKYKSKMEKLEAGKYLIETGKITYPEVYKTRSAADGYQLHIEAPVVERSFSAEDLFIVPLEDGNKKGRYIKRSPNSYESTSEITDGFAIPSLSEENDSAPVVSKDSGRRVYVDIRHKNSNIREFLDDYNSKYSESDSGFRVEFKSEKEKRKFCTDLTGQANCYGLN